MDICAIILLNMKTILIKQANNRNVAHIYEHTLINFVEKELFARNYLCDMDYNYSAYTIGNNIVISFEARREVMNLFLKSVRQFQPSTEAVKWAVQEISNEYFRPYKADFDKLFTKIQQTHQNKWQNWQNLKLTKPVKKSNSAYRSPEVQFLKQDTKLFEIFQIETRTRKLAPELKPLASYVLYFLQIAGTTKLNRYGLKGQASYCDGYDWNVDYYSNLEDFVGRRIFFTFQKGVVSSQEVLKLINSETARLLSTGLAQKICDFLQNMQIDNYIFNNDELFQYSGFIAGGKYFKQFATLENIEKIIKQIGTVVEIEK